MQIKDGLALKDLENVFQTWLSDKYSTCNLKTRINDSTDPQDKGERKTNFTFYNQYAFVQISHEGICFLRDLPSRYEQ